MKQLFLATFILVSLPLLAQNPAPGGVVGAWQWWYSEPGAATHQWQTGTDQRSFSEDESSPINYWPSPDWQQLALPPAMNLPAAFSTSATIFVVYTPPAGEQEQVLWSWQELGDAPLVSTNKRLAHLEERKYLNFLEQRSGTRLQTYRHVLSHSSKDQQKVFALGQLTTPASIPARRWSAPLAEFILFPRVLPPTEQTKVETYLALKYGTTLGISGQGSDYLSSTGAIIWAAEQHQEYHHRVFGLGKDLGSGWEQNHSCAAEAPELISIKLSGTPEQNGLHPLDLPDHTFLVMGDNNSELRWQAHPSTAEWELLERKWRGVLTGSLREQTVEAQIDLGRWLGSDVDAYEYQIVVSSTGANFSWSELDRFTQTELSKGRFGRFAAIQLPPAGTFHFTLARRLKSDAHAQHPNLRVYPNPVQQGNAWQWQLRTEQETPLAASLTNAKGQLYWQKKHPSGNYFAAEEAPLPTGTYWLKLETNTKTFTQKIVVQ